MEETSNFIKTIMKEDLESGRVKEIITRFPPEPNAYLHIGHARAIITDFETAKAFGGYTNLRFDDTNPTKEKSEFVDAIIKDINWLGYTPKNVYYGSDYFDADYEKAILLIKKGLAYVDDLSQEEMARQRDTTQGDGIESPYRNRSVEENLRLFEEMRQGKYADGEKTLRAKIDMKSPNVNMRDPVIYRIVHMEHHRQGNKWCIYPMYDFAHPLQDAFEGITHSLCSIEYDNHRPLYDWVVDNCDVITETSHPHQYEFGRLNIANTVLSKRYLRALVDSKKVSGYDDCRMPTLVGFRRKGVTAEAIKNFIISTGLSRINSTIEPEILDNFVREDLKLKANRVSAILRPLKVTITNYPEGQVEWLDAPNNLENEELGTRKVAFSKHLYIDQNDFIEEKPNKKWKRLAKDVEVRLMFAYFIKCTDVIKDENGNIVEILATYDPETKSGSGFDARKPNGTINYVEATTAVPAEFRLFESLLAPETEENKDLDFMERLNPNSLTVINGFVESALKDTNVGDHYQFLREGFYATDKDSTSDKIVFNRTCDLKSSFVAK
ncbi:MAG: glutamine--tRNA ligase/YqeY domain fusion protein [Acholeplasmatales bacterium]|nr:glutamine--tRNA ligase/YqeY domain fusion protein [Acholeplasmatales bacterium]